MGVVEGCVLHNLLQCATTKAVKLVITAIGSATWCEGVPDMLRMYAFFARLSSGGASASFLMMLIS
jgi:hypothetical protein